MTKSSTVHIGMDVHEASIDIALAEAGALGEEGQYGKVVGDLASLDRAIRTLALGKNGTRDQAWSIA